MYSTMYTFYSLSPSLPFSLSPPPSLPLSLSLPPPLSLCRLQLDSSEQCRLWCHRVQEGLKPSANFRDAFAFIHYAYLSDGSSTKRKQLKSMKHISSFITNLPPLLYREGHSFLIDRAVNFRVFQTWFQ